MLISIITPSYNQGKYLPDLIQSVKSQTYRPVEHIIMDGSSTDGTQTILQAYEADPDGIMVKWASEKDRGQAHAVNKGFALAKGDIVGWINSDDAYFHRRVFERVVREFDNHPDVDIIHGNLALISADNLLGIIWCIPEFNYERMYIDGKIAQATVFFRRKVIEENHLRENFLSLDYEFWLRLGKKYRFKHINDILACDRDQPDRISRVNAALLSESHLIAKNDNPPKISKIHRIWFKVSELPIRGMNRLNGLFQYLRINGGSDYFAFDCHIDNKTAVVKRQLFGRIGKLFESK